MRAPIAFKPVHLVRLISWGLAEGICRARVRWI